MGPSTLVLVLKYYKYSYESTCTYTKVLPSFLHSNCTCIQVLSYVFTSTKILVSTLKYFEVHLSPLILILPIKLTMLTLLKFMLRVVLNHLQRRAKPYLASCQSLRLKPYLSRVIQTQTITLHLLVSPLIQIQPSIRKRIIDSVHLLRSLPKNFLEYLLYPHQ